MQTCFPGPAARYRMGCGSSSELQEGEARTVVVFGSTGLLGGAVARALLQDPLHFHVRAVTRRPSSEKARKLAEDGAVIVTANQNDIASLEKAMSGADAVFLTTHYWEDRSKEKEIVKGLNSIDAAIRKGVSHVVFNGSENVKKLIGKACGHLDSKAAIEEYLREVGVNYTVLRLPFWYENFSTVFRPHKVKHGVYAIALPMEDSPLDMISVEDVGACVARIFTRPRYYSHRTVGLAADRLTTAQIAHAMGRHLYNKKFIHPKVRVKDFERFSFPGAKELAAMFELYQKEALVRDVKLTRKLYPGVRTLDRWLHEEAEEVETALRDQDDTEKTGD